MGWTHQGHVLTSMARRICGFRLKHKAIAQFQCRFQRLQLSVSPMSLKFLWQKLSTLLINRTCRHLEGDCMRCSRFLPASNPLQRDQRGGVLHLALLAI